MSNVHFGEICALLSALSWAGALVLFKLSGERIPPLALNLFKNTVALILLTLTLLVLGDGPEKVLQFEPADLITLMLSGFLGIAVADTVFFFSLNLMGVGLVAIVECLYSPLVILCAALLLSETLHVNHYLGGALIIFAVLICSRHEVPLGRTRGQIVAGFVLGAAAMALMAFGIVMAKPVLEVNHFPLIWAATLRLVAGTVALAALALASPKRLGHFAGFKPSRIWWVSIPGAVLGTYFAMIFWVAGFKYAKASIAAILNQTSVIFAIILATLILREPFTRRKLIAVVLAAGGVFLASRETGAQVVPGKTSHRHFPDAPARCSDQCKVGLRPEVSFAPGRGAPTASNQVDRRRHPRSPVYPRGHYDIHLRRSGAQQNPGALLHRRAGRAYVIHQQQLRAFQSCAATYREGAAHILHPRRKAQARLVRAAARAPEQVYTRDRT